MEEKKNEKKRGWKTILKNYWYLPVVAVTVYVLFHTVFFLGYVPSMSMSPTLDQGAGIFSVRISKTELEYGEIVLFHPNIKGNEKTLWVKRIIGLPGDEIRTEGSSVYRNGKKLAEPYVKNDNIKYETKVYHVPEDTVFLLGDNRCDSFDSRYWEDPFLSLDNLVAKPLFTAPLSRGCDSGVKKLN